MAAGLEVLHTPDFTSPTQRQSARRRKGPVNLAGTPSAACNHFLSENDDEQERRQRRRSLHLTNNILSPSTGHTTPRTRSNTTSDVER